MNAPPPVSPSPLQFTWLHRTREYIAAMRRRGFVEVDPWPADLFLFELRRADGAEIVALSPRLTRHTFSPRGSIPVPMLAKRGGHSIWSELVLTQEEQEGRHVDRRIPE